jgi:uncharacterized protein (TIGR02145 family)
MKKTLTSFALTIALFALLYAVNFVQSKDSPAKPLDDKTYKTVKMGDQVWMLENLKFDLDESKCYDDKPANCEQYGKLYNWETAKTACPKGWHLPTDEEWKKLIAFAGGEKKAGKQLKEKNGWASLPGGYFFVSDSEEMPSHFEKLGIDGCWWSTSVGNDFEEYKTGNRWFIMGNDKIESLPDEYGNSCSVRCVKDSI